MGNVEGTTSGPNRTNEKPKCKQSTQKNGQEDQGEDFQDLNTLCRHKRWDAVEEMSHSYSHSVHPATGNTPLHTALSNYAPFTVVQALVHANPPSVQDPNKNGNTALHFIAWKNKGHPDDEALRIVQFLLHYHPQCAQKPNNAGSLPLHFATQYKAHIAIIQAIYLAFPKGSTVQNHKGQTPVDLARDRLGNQHTVVDVLQGSTTVHFDAPHQTDGHAIVTAPTKRAKPDDKPAQMQTMPPLPTVEGNAKPILAAGSRPVDENPEKAVGKSDLPTEPDLTCTDATLALPSDERAAPVTSGADSVMYTQESATSLEDVTSELDAIDVNNIEGSDNEPDDSTLNEDNDTASRIRAPTKESDRITLDPLPDGTANGTSTNEGNTDATTTGVLKSATTTNSAMEFTYQESAPSSVGATQGISGSTSYNGNRPKTLTPSEDHTDDTVTSILEVSTAAHQKTTHDSNAGDTPPVDCGDGDLTPETGTNELAPGSSIDKQKQVGTSPNLPMPTDDEAVEVCPTQDSNPRSRDKPISPREATSKDIVYKPTAALPFSQEVDADICLPRSSTTKVIAKGDSEESSQQTHLDTPTPFNGTVGPPRNTPKDTTEGTMEGFGQDQSQTDSTTSNTAENAISEGSGGYQQPIPVEPTSSDNQDDAATSGPTRSPSNDEALHELPNASTNKSSLSSLIPSTSNAIGDDGAINVTRMGMPAPADDHPTESISQVDQVTTERSSGGTNQYTAPTAQPTDKLGHDATYSFQESAISAAWSILSAAGNFGGVEKETQKPVTNKPPPDSVQPPSTQQGTQDQEGRVQPVFDLDLHTLCMKKDWEAVVERAHLYDAIHHTTLNAGNAPLHTAISNHAPLSVIESLVRANPPTVHCQNKNGNTPLHFAAWKNKGKDSFLVVKFLLEYHHQCAQMLNHSGRLPIHFAADYKAPEDIVRAIHLAHPDGISIPDKNGKTPLDLALHRLGDKHKVVALLRGAKTRSYVYNALNQTHAGTPSQIGSINLSKDASEQQSMERASEPLTGEKPSPGPSAKTTEGLDSSRLEDLRGHHNNELRDKAETSTTASNACIERSTPTKPTALCTTLPENSSYTVKPKQSNEVSRSETEDDNLPENEKDCKEPEKRSFDLELHTLCKTKQWDAVVERAHLYDVIHHTTLNAGNAPLHTAISNHAPLKVVEALVHANPPSVHCQNKNGNTPLHFAAWKNKGKDTVHIVQFLLEYHPQCARVTNHAGSLPLHFAANYKAPEDIVHYIYRAHPEGVSVFDKNGKTPLDLALHRHGEKHNIVILLKGATTRSYVYQQLGPSIK